MAVKKKSVIRLFIIDDLFQFFNALQNFPKQNSQNKKSDLIIYGSQTDDFSVYFSCFQTLDVGGHVIAVLAQRVNT